LKGRFGAHFFANRSWSMAGVPTAEINATLLSVDGRGQPPVWRRHMGAATNAALLKHHSSSIYGSLTIVHNGCVRRGCVDMQRDIQIPQADFQGAFSFEGKS
jgi:hypothetical protein